MDNSPVPDLFCSEILSDLDDITSYYNEHVKSEIPCDLPLDQDNIQLDSQNVPEHEPSLLETWVEIWQSHTDSVTPQTGLNGLNSPQTVTGELNVFHDVAPECINPVETEVADEDQSDILNEGEISQTTSQESSVESFISPPTSTLNQTESMSLSTSGSRDLSNEELAAYILSLHGHTSTERIAVPESHEDDPPVIPDDAENTDGGQGLVPNIGTVSERNDMLQLPEDAVEEENMASSSSASHATNIQVVPNLQMLLMAHRNKAECEEEDDRDDSYTDLRFHESPCSPLNPFDESQVVPLWDLEE